MSARVEVVRAVDLPAHLDSIRSTAWLVPLVGTVCGWAAVVAVALLHTSGHTHHLLGIAAMSVAMMSPLAIPVCQVTARRTIWQMTNRCVLVTYVAFVGVWVAAGAALHVLAEATMVVVPERVLVVLLATWCGVDAMTRRRSVRIAACSVARPAVPGAPLLGAVELGASAGRACVGTCAAVMALSVVEPSLMVPASVVVLVERVVQPPPRACIALAFGAVAITALLTLRS
jgi:predicted metal-binding membrane protein